MRTTSCLLAALAGLAVGLAPALAGAAAPSGPVSAARMTVTVKALSSDAFQGRAPGTPGEAVTVAYLTARLKAMGLEPGGANGSWTQAVPLVRTKLGAPTKLEITGLGAPILPVRGGNITLSTARPVDEVAIRNAPLVFVGYGVSAPERGWDDYKGVDLHSKIAVFLVNDPDFEALPGEPVAGKFGGKAMTYYGRWTYKYEEAARRGAIGALIVHETPAAGYGWSTVNAGVGETFDVARPANGPQPVLIEGWLRRDFAVDLFRRAGLDFDALKVRARRADFHPVPLGGARLTLDAPVTHSQILSHNVLAKITGAKRPGETVMFGAHWDAFGIGPPDASGQVIRRGANDDGLGDAGVLEIARAFRAAPRPDRTVVFAIWTAEERGLLGSEYYAEHPIYPLATTVADFTMDVLQTAGLSRNVVLVGAGQDSLEKDLDAAAARQGRVVTPDSHPERGLFFRADHFSLAKRGVPTLLIMALGGGPDLVKGGQAAGDRWVSDYTAHCYHKPCDAWSPAWDLSGAVQDVDLVYEVGREIANSDVWPTWDAGSEFGVVRAKSAAQRR